MAVLAAIPSLSVLTVTSRASSLGLRHGVYTSMGIVSGDIVYILIAILGLAILAEQLGDLFVLVKYFGGAYLIWLGLSSWPGSATNKNIARQADVSVFASYAAGLLLTLADQKAILFYLGLFPAFVDLPAITFADVVIVIGITIVAVGGVKLFYAYLASRGSMVLGDTASRIFSRLAALVLIMIGLYILYSAYGSAT